MKIGIVVGTRPEVIKMAPVIRECQRRQIPFFVIHSNQHYSPDMDAIFFEELELPAPHYNLHVGSGLHSNQTGNILIKMEPILVEEKPDVVLVQGDTNTVLAGALAASKLDIKVGHIEAGLRSYDRTMPEETNRVLTDHMSNYLFSVSKNQTNILKAEGIANEKIHEVGNTISDALFQHVPLANKKSQILQTLDIESQSYVLVTAHRASNVDIKASLLELVDLISSVADRYGKNVVWPIHPRTRKKLEEFDVKLNEKIILSQPLGYLDFIQLQQNAKLILTDSGGIQEEACMLHIPCVTLRENTERPESIEVGANVLVGRDKEKAFTAIDEWLKQDKFDWANPFGNGDVAQKIISHVVGEAPDKATLETGATSKGSVAVVGQGYMGLPIACLIAKGGYDVTGVDLNSKVVDAINKASCPFNEEGLPELIKSVVKSGKMRASTETPNSDIYLVAVPTPHKDKKCDTRYVMSAIDSIAKIANDGQLVIIESTISPQTSLNAQKRLAEKGLDIDVVHCPERAIPGQTLHELVYNDRIIGAPNQEAYEKAATLYGSFVKGEIFQTDTTTAECVKLVENTSRDVGIAFANELAEIADELHINVHDVIRLANRHPRVNILTPGPGVGGHCIPIDPWFLVERTQSGDFVRQARKINDDRPIKVAEKALTELKITNGKKIGLLGVAYKPNVDDLRETPAVPILKHLQANGCEVKFHDPHISEWKCEKIETLEDMKAWADLTLVVTNHSEYAIIEKNSSQIILNGCGQRISG